jgi:hypothetical protein
MEPAGCPETSVLNYQSTMRQIPEEVKTLFTDVNELKIEIKQDTYLLVM